LGSRVRMFVIHGGGYTQGFPARQPRK
jgi:hypothetical protein